MAETMRYATTNDYKDRSNVFQMLEIGFTALEISKELELPYTQVQMYKASYEAQKAHPSGN